MSKPRILVFGLDGGSFNFISGWLRDGKLPNLARLVAEGTRGEMESALPPVTSPAWKCYAAGKYAGKLGVFWWQQLDPRTREVITPTSHTFKSAEVWDYLNQAGLRTGVIGVPRTYPPKPLNGFMVCGGPDVSQTGYTSPPELAADLEQTLAYELNIKGDFFNATKDSPVVQEALRVIDKTFAAGAYLHGKDPVDFLHITTFDLNRIQHFFFDEEPTLWAWQVVDKWLGELVPQFDYTLVMSDHGTARVAKAFFLNAWLKQQGYLFTRTRPADALFRLGLNRTAISRLLDVLHLKRLFPFELMRRVAYLLPSSTGVYGEFGNQAVVQRIDWTRTRAFALAQGPVYINRDLVPTEAAYQALCAELIAAIEAIRDPETDARVFVKVYRRDEAFQGPYATDGPDLLALNADEYHNRAGLAQPNPFEAHWQWKGNNRRFGMCLLHGPGIRQQTEISGARIVDLAPTILHLAGVPLPDDLDGRVLMDAFEPGSAPALQPLRYQPNLTAPAGDAAPPGADATYDDEVASRLTGLGYLG